MKVLSAKQPFTYLLCAGIKDIENRTWPLPEKYKDEWVLIHASALYSGKTSTGCLNSEQFHYLSRIHQLHHVSIRLTRAAIIGAVKFTDCVINHPSIWAEKTPLFDENMNPVSFRKYTGIKPIYNWVVSDAVLFEKPVLNVKGRLGFWDYPAEMIVCPECGKICLHSGEGISQYVHNCEHCGFWITESDYETVK